MNDGCCEAPDCSLPGTTCLVCDQCFCWKHRQSSSCETCHKLLFQGSFEQRLGRLLSIGLCVLLAGVLLLLLPRDNDGILIQLAIFLLVVGSMLTWLGLLVRV